MEDISSKELKDVLKTINCPSVGPQMTITEYPDVDSGIGSEVQSRSNTMSTSVTFALFESSPSTSVKFAELPSHSTYTYEMLCAMYERCGQIPTNDSASPITALGSIDQIKSREKISRPMNSTQKENLIKGIIYGNLGYFVKTTDLQLLHPHLSCAKLVSTKELGELQAIKCYRSKNNLFYLILLSKKGDNVYKTLLECLKNEREHLGHKHLANMIDRELKESNS